jgi:hypothetical protein
MPDWLQSTFPQQIPWGDLVVRMLAALVLGMLVAAIYRFVRRGLPAAPQFLATLVLLAVLIAMVTQIVGGNVALAFSLVGALSIVRFRTVVRDTQDTAYVIFAVVEGMAAGSNQLGVALVGMATVTLAALLMRLRAAAEVAAEQSAKLVFRVGLSPHPEQVGQAVLDRHVERRLLRSAATVRQGGAIELTYEVWLRDDSSLGTLVAELNQVEGVQSVEISQQTGDDQTDGS